MKEVCLVEVYNNSCYECGRKNDQIIGPWEVITDEEYMLLCKWVDRQWKNHQEDNTALFYTIFLKPQKTIPMLIQEAIEEGRRLEQKALESKKIREEKKARAEAKRLEKTKKSELEELKRLKTKYDEAYSR